MHFIALGLILTGSSLFLGLNAFRGFNFFDMGGFLDASWQVFQGRRANIDFIYFSGPTHLYMNAFFFLLFGYGKAAILAHLLSVNAVVTTATFLLTYRRIPPALALLVTALSATCFYGPISHPWYDQSAHLWGILGLWLLVSLIPFPNKRRAFIAGLGCGLLSVVSFTAKYNIGAAYGGVFFLVLLCLPSRASSISGFLVGSFLGFVLFLILIQSPYAYFEQIRTSYGLQTVGARVEGLTRATGWLINRYWSSTLITFLPLLTRLKRIRDWGLWFVLFLGVTFVGIFSAQTGSMELEANIPLWGLHMAFAFISLFKAFDFSREGIWPKIFHGVPIFALVLGTVGLLLVSLQYGLELRVWAYANINPLGDYVLQTEPFRGWRSRRASGEIFDRMAAYLRTHLPKEETFANLTDMQLLYSVTERAPYPPGMPYLFHTIVSADRRWQFPYLEQMKSLLAKNPPDWILIHEGEAQLETDFFVHGIGQALGIDKELRTRYDRLAAWEPYVLYKKRSPKGA